MGINARVLLLLLLLVLGGVFHIGSETSPVIVLVFAICITSFLFSIYLTKWVLAKDEGPPEMTQVIAHHSYFVLWDMTISADFSSIFNFQHPEYILNFLPWYDIYCSKKIKTIPVYL